MRSVYVHVRFLFRLPSGSLIIGCVPARTALCTACAYILRSETSYLEHGVADLAETEFLLVAIRGERTGVTRGKLGRAICARRLEVSVGLCNNKCTAPWIKFNIRMTVLVLRGCDASISED